MRQFIDNSINFPDTIKHIKAPTDESIRLLNEFQEKAMENIIAKINVTDNILNGVVLSYATPYSYATNKYALWLKFKVNGKEFNLKKEVDADELNDYKLKSDLHKYLRDNLKIHIAEIIINHLQMDLLKILQEQS